jgi:4-amino-4-deoxy-L-arabinose transferase-like glycosyltransferase
MRTETRSERSQDEVDAPVDRTSDRTFTRRLLLIAAFGFVLRGVYILHLRDRTVKGDGITYHAVSNLVAAGKGFVYGFGGDQLLKTAEHPPLWEIVLAIFARLGLHSFLSQQLVAAFIGALTIIATGYAGRRIAGGRVGLIAALIVSVTPTFFFSEWELMSETLAVLGAALILLFAYRFRDKPSLAGALVVGVMCGLLGLTHSEQFLLVVFLLAPLVLLARDVPRRTRWLWLTAATAATIAVAAPWAVYSTARFRDPVLVSTEFGPTLAAANCQNAYYGPRIGWDGGCVFGAAYAVGHTEDESTQDVALRHFALDYIKHHAGRVPVVVAAREGRIFGVFHPTQQMQLDSFRGTPESYIRVGFIVSWVLEIAAIIGVFVLRRRDIAVYPLLAFVATVVIGVALTYGQTRFRAPAEVSLAILAAAAIESGVRRLRIDRLPRQGTEPVGGARREMRSDPAPEFVRSGDQSAPQRAIAPQ